MGNQFQAHSLPQVQAKPAAKSSNRIFKEYFRTAKRSIKHQLGKIHGTTGRIVCQVDKIRRNSTLKTESSERFVIDQASMHSAGEVVPAPSVCTPLKRSIHLTIPSTELQSRRPQRATQSNVPARWQPLKSHPVLFSRGYAVHPQKTQARV